MLESFGCFIYKIFTSKTRFLVISKTVDAVGRLSDLYLYSSCHNCYLSPCSLAGAMIASIIRGYEPHMCVKAGLHAAFLSLQTHDAISDQVSLDKFTVESVQDWVTLSPRDIAV